MKKAKFAQYALELCLPLIYTSRGMRKQLQLLAAFTVNHAKSVYLNNTGRFTCKLAQQRSPLWHLLCCVSRPQWLVISVLVAINNTTIHSKDSSNSKVYKVLHL